MTLCAGQDPANAEKRFHAASLFSFLREGINNISALLSVTYI